MANISIVGAGSWGTALSLVARENGHSVTVWSYNPEQVKRLNECRENDKLPGVSLPREIVFTSDIQEAVEDKELIILVVPSVHIRKTARLMAPFIKEGQIIADASKGIEEDTLMTLTQIIEEEIPSAKAAVLSGPSHAEEVALRKPTAVVAGAKQKETADFIQNVLMNQYFRVYTSSDILGIELGGALKNVIALAAGIADGLGCGDNAKAALITRGITEISRLGTAMGGRAETFSGLTGTGDLIVTCASMHSRNRRAGILMGQGKSPEEAMAEVKQVVEGVYSAKAALALSRKYEIQMPITEKVNELLFSDCNAAETMLDLMLRDKKSEEQGDWS